MRGRLGLMLAALLVAAPATAPQDPIVSIWYRGRPAGVPHAQDLAEIQAAGFTAVTWPLANTVGLRELTRLAEEARLTVVVRAEAAPLTPAAALQPTERVDLLMAKTTAAQLPSLAWRAVGHGARVVSIDAGQPEGAGLTDGAGRAAAWLGAAEDLARQFRVNGALIAQLGEMPPLNFNGLKPAGLDVVLLEANKSWVAIATNTSPLRVRAALRMPSDVPYAIWLNLLNGATLAMLADPAGARWNIDLEGYGARVYVIDKKLK